jgi:DNA-binding response OmpR family regulator
MKVLIAEDEDEILQAYKIALEARGHNVILSKDGAACLEEYRKNTLLAHEDMNQKKKKSNSIDVVVLDYRSFELL